jgi:hypothetical protein
MRVFVLPGTKFHRVLTIAAVAATALAFAPVHQASAASTFKILHTFCSFKIYCYDGYAPRASVLVMQSNEIYGTTYLGGKYDQGGHGGGRVQAGLR